MNLGWASLSYLVWSNSRLFSADGWTVWHQCRHGTLHVWWNPDWGYHRVWKPESIRRLFHHAIVHRSPRLFFWRKCLYTDNSRWYRDPDAGWHKKLWFSDATFRIYGALYFEWHSGRWCSGNIEHIFINHLVFYTARTTSGKWNVVLAVLLCYLPVYSFYTFLLKLSHIWKLM